MFRLFFYLKTINSLKKSLAEAEISERMALERVGELTQDVERYKNIASELQIKLNSVQHGCIEDDGGSQSSEDWYDGCDIVPAAFLSGWKWTEYHDGSGSLDSPDGKSYFQYDLSTKEYRHPGVEGNNWRFFSGYPYECIGFGEFKEFAERWILKNILCN